MALSFGARSTIMQSAEDRERIAGAALTAAINISNESPGTTNHAKRILLANVVLLNWESIATVFIRYVLAHDLIRNLANLEAFRADTTDEVLSNVMGGIWDNFAKAKFPD